MNKLPARLDLINRFSPGTIGAEIGVLRGEFSAQILSCPVAKLFLIDPWCEQRPDVYTDFWNKCNHSDNIEYVRERFAQDIAIDRVSVIQGLSEEVAMAHPEIPALDWVFIDGNHKFQYVLLDLILWSKRLKPGGIIMGHDYIDTQDWGVIAAVDDFCKHFGWELDCLTCESDWPSFSLKQV